jgi:tyrosyl-tRNA synthetase
MFGALMSISDELMSRYYELLSDRSLAEVAEIRAGRVHPMEAKKGLAAEMVARFHGPDAADAARTAFESRFQRRETPTDVAVHTWAGSESSVGICRLLHETGLAASKGEARRLVEQGAVRIDGTKLVDPTGEIPTAGAPLVEVGKRRILRIRFAS